MTALYSLTLCVQGLVTLTGSQGAAVIQSHKGSLDTTLTQNNNGFVYYIIMLLCNDCIMQEGQHPYQKLLAYHAQAIFLNKLI